MARGTPVAGAAEKPKDERIEILNGNPIPQSVDMSPPGNRLDPDMGDAPPDRASINPDVVAPVVRSALDAPVLRVGHGSTGPVLKGTPAEDTPPARRYRVEKQASIVDRTSGARTLLREGKEIEDKHYMIRDLQRQGVKLRDVTDLDPNAPL